MKKTPSYLSIVLLCCMASCLTAQERFRKFHVEAGVNSISLLDRIVRRNPDSITAENTPYSLSLRLSHGLVGLRFTGGGRYRKEVAQERGFLDSRTTFDQVTNVRVGLDYRVPMGRRFSVAVGADALWDFSQNEEIIDSGFDVLRRVDQSEAWGGGATIGLYYWINRRIALYTESGVYYKAGTTERGRFFENFPELNDNIQNIETTEVKTLAPTSLFLIFRF
jgi:hypothetical protein